MIHVIATIEIAPGRRDDFLAAFHEIVPEVRAEDGCIEYGPATDQAVTIGNPPAIPRDDFVTVIEKWSSVEALLKHHVAPAHAAVWPDRKGDCEKGGDSGAGAGVDRLKFRELAVDSVRHDG